MTERKQRCKPVNVANTGRARRYNGITGELQDEQRLSLFMEHHSAEFHPFPFVLAQLLCQPLRLSSPFRFSLLSSFPIPLHIFVSLLFVFVPIAPNFTNLRPQYSPRLSSSSSSPSRASADSSLSFVRRYPGFSAMI